MRILDKLSGRSAPAQTSSTPAPPRVPPPSDPRDFPHLPAATLEPAVLARFGEQREAHLRRIAWDKNARALTLTEVPPFAWAEPPGVGGFRIIPRGSNDIAFLPSLDDLPALLEDARPALRTSAGTLLNVMDLPLLGCKVLRDQSAVDLRYQRQDMARRPDDTLRRE